VSHARLTRDVVLNGLGWVIPAALALVAIPALTRALGPDRFGLLALAWAAVSVFAILDLGLGRALTLLVAEREASGALSAAASAVPALARAAGVLAWAIFLPLALVGAWLAPWIVAQALDLPPAMVDEAVRVVRMLALALPVVVHGILLRAVFEGQQRFVMVNALRIPLGVVTWGGPWLAAAWTQDVSALALVIVGGRAAYWLAQWAVLGADFARHAAAVPAAAAPSAASAAGVVPEAQSAYHELFARGSWITLSGIISPVLTGADRLVVPLVAPIAAVGWYVAAGEAATKLWLVTAALTPVLAPALASAFARRAEGEFRALLRKAAWAVALLLLPPALLGLVFAEPLLAWWLADAYAAAVVPTFRLFVVAVYVNSVAQVAYAGLQAGGRARAAALLHVVELPVFVAALWWLGAEYGATGAAWAWAGRMIVDAVGMMGLAWRRAGTVS
jgi:O-antigen/teichoic acid export membrane protein